MYGLVGYITWVDGLYPLVKLPSLVRPLESPNVEAPARTPGKLAKIPRYRVPETLFWFSSCQIIFGWKYGMADGMQCFYR